MKAYSFISVTASGIRSTIQVMAYSLQEAIRKAKTKASNNNAYLLNV